MSKNTIPPAYTPKEKFRFTLCSSKVSLNPPPPTSSPLTIYGEQHLMRFDFKVEYVPRDSNEDHCLRRGFFESRGIKSLKSTSVVIGKSDFSGTMIGSFPSLGSASFPSIFSLSLQATAEILPISKFRKLKSAALCWNFDFFFWARRLGSTADVALLVCCNHDMLI